MLAQWTKVHWAYMGPTWGRQNPGGSHVGPMNLAIRACISNHIHCFMWGVITHPRPNFNGGLEPDPEDMTHCLGKRHPDSMVHWAYMGPTWGRQNPGGSHVGLMNLAIRACINNHIHCFMWGVITHPRPNFNGGLEPDPEDMTHCIGKGHL